MPELEDRAVIVIDTLRATTTISAILSHGAAGVLPVAGVREAYALKEQDPTLILGGERENNPLPGFDAGNSPYDYPSDLVQGRRVVLTTTNGTQAVKRVAAALWVGLGALVNARAAARAQQEAAERGLIVCAGTEGHIALEDVLAAGAVARHWDWETRTDRARIAEALFAQWQHDVYAGLAQAAHAQLLIRQGMECDVRFAAQLDLFSQAPVRGNQGWFMPVIP
jgi:2-phosphosulfolactate phosphatase